MSFTYEPASYKKGNPNENQFASFLRDIEITTTLETNAPEPILKVGVKQGNSLVNGELNVKPGTPLTMEIYLDKESAPIYGLLVSFMRVSDTKQQDETIIFNG